MTHDEFALSNNVLKRRNQKMKYLISLSKIYMKLYLYLQSIYETMSSSCLKCRKNAESKNPKVAKIRKERIMFLSKWSGYDS